MSPLTKLMYAGADVVSETEVGGGLIVATVRMSGHLYVYRGPASHLEEWCRQIDRMQKA